MKRTIAIVVSMIFVLSLSGPAFARMGMKRAIGDSPIRDAQGEVKSIDQKEKTIVVEAMRGLVVVTADERTVVRMDKTVVAFSDLKVGDKVVLTYGMGEGKNIAKTIVISPPAVAPSEDKEDTNKAEEKK